jgi:hypothetical protein
VAGAVQYGVFDWRGNRWRTLALTTGTQVTVPSPKGKCLRYTVSAIFADATEMRNDTGIEACR